ncbi:hypothetical protein K3495_g16984, partial [Podosphaera aphanis]
MPENWESPISNPSPTTASPSTQSINLDEEFNLRIRSLPLSILNGKREVLEKSLELPTMSNATSHPEPKLPTFERSGTYDGSIPASRWLLRLKYDFRRAGHNPPSGELYLESIEMLLDGTAANRLSATPRIRRIIDSRNTATPEDICEVNEWLKEEFPNNFEDDVEQNVQSEIQNFSQRKKDDQNDQKPEALAAYYHR